MIVIYVGGIYVVLVFIVGNNIIVIKVVIDNLDVYGSIGGEVGL